MTTPSTKPYLIRAVSEWCTDQGFTPYLAVFVDEHVHVPMQYVNENQIVLNISHESTSGLRLENDMISFTARFGGVPHEVFIPIGNVAAIYAKENGEGMGFDLALLPEKSATSGPELHAVPTLKSVKDSEQEKKTPEDDPSSKKSTKKPTLTRIK